MANEMEMAHMGLTPYENFKVANMASRRPSNGAITGLVLGSVALAYDALATLYNHAYKTITTGAAKDIQAPADEAGAEAGPDAVPQMQIEK